VTKFTNDFSREVWESTYKFGNEQTIDDTFRRIAKAVAANELDSVYWEEIFFEILSDFKFVPGGRIASNAGTNIKGTSLINCFVDNFEGTDQDSMESIMDALKRQALILKSEGGYGTNFDVLRPKGAFIDGIANETPGPVTMMEMWDKQSEVITKGSGKVSDKVDSKKKIRKGAQMAVMSVWHPDIEDFITAKQTPGQLSKFNMSVGITDDFMFAVKNHLPWNLVFPDYEVYKTSYVQSWDGDITKWSKQYGVKVYKTYSDANILWELITKSTYNRNEPGILFIDTINKMNNLYYCEHIFATNPCGEQPLGDGSVCLLSNINLTQYVKDNIWDYDKLNADIPVMIRFMDNINEIANVPLLKQKQSLLGKRRIGLGVMGYASALLLMGKKYGGKEALVITEDLMSFIANKAYQSSALLAQEKGSFPMYNADEYLKSEYLKVLDPVTIGLINQCGIRNSHLLSIAPTGNTSATANNVSGGLEPLFSTDYYRTFIVSTPPPDLVLPDKIDWINRTGNTNGWTWIGEGNDNLLAINFKDGFYYKYDKNRGLTKVVHIEDFGYAKLENKTADFIVTSGNLSIDAHVETMKIFAKYMDAAVSKTINIPSNFSFEEFKDVYMRVYDTGYIKGCTTYREGTMMNVLSTTVQTLDEKNNALKRPKKLSCDIHHLTVAGQKWIVLVGLIEPGKPYEVFAFKNKNINLSPTINKGYLTKVKSGQYNLELEYLSLDNVTELFDQDEEEALTRMVSMALRHNVDIKYVTDQLDKAQGTIVSFSKAISRTLKKYVKDVTTKELCPECGSTLIKVEGCTKCSSCDYSIC